MKTFTIAEALEMAGMVVPRIEATILNIYPRKTGDGQYGPWSLQNALIEDSTGKMKAVFKQLPDESKLEGRTLVFKSIETKHGLKGVEVKANEYKGKTTMELHISKVALIVSKDEEANVSWAEPSTRLPQNEPQMPLEAPKPHNDTKVGIGLTKNRLTQLAGLYDLCWKTVGGMDCREALELDQQKDVATTLFIQSCREGLADKMPVRTLSKFYNEEAIKPSSAKHRGEPDGFDGDSGSEDDLAKEDIPF